MVFGYLIEKGDKGVALMRDEKETLATVTPGAGFYNH
jgi:hypothetical protein